MSSDRPVTKKKSSNSRILLRRCALLVMTLSIAMVSQGQRMKVPENGDFTKFQHTSEYHARLPCALCHRRETNSPTPSLPGKANHAPCAGCHVKQFADQNSAICTICHTNTQTGSLKAFPKLTSFNMTFDHARHVGMGNVSCATCHKPIRNGVGMTIPSGASAHITCFQCHGPQAKVDDRDLGSCGVCHRPGPSTRTAQTAAAFSLCHCTTRKLETG